MINIPHYQSGQVWAYKTRPQEPDSTLTILKVDDDEGAPGRTIHICIDGLKVKSPWAVDGISPSIGHSPIAEAALAESTTELLKEDVPLPSMDGYNEWKRAHDAGQAGTFSISVCEIVECIENAINKAENVNQQ